MACLVSLLLASPSFSELPSGSPAPTRPALKQLRYDEDWRVVCDPQQRSDDLDPLKCIPLNANAESYLSLGGELRPYYELYDNEDWGAEPDDDGGWLLQRYMFHADLHLGEHLRFFGQLKSGLEDGREGGPRPPDEDQLDVHQGFVDLAANLSDGGSLTLRAGRQELVFGSSRLVSTREGPNVRQSFDGLRVSLREGEWTVDALATKPVETNRGVFDDAPDDARSLWGIYAVRPLSLLPLNGSVDLYYLGLYRKHARFEQGTGRERRHTIGTRLWNPGGTLDYNFELVYQFGVFDSGRSGDINAWTVASDTGYTFRTVALRPRLGLKANVTSGDRDRTDPDLETFNPLFPKGAYFGQLSPVGPLNHRDLHPNLELSFLRGVSVTLDWVFFWRQSKRDAVYGVPGNIQRPGNQSNARFIGHQPGLEVAWEVDPHTTVTVDYARFEAGRFLRETPPGKDIGYFAAWVTYKF